MAADDSARRQQAFERGFAALDAILRVQPDHFVALETLLRMAQFIDPTRAWAPAVRYADLRPTSARAQVIAAQLAMTHGDVPTARRYVNRARALGVPLTHYAARPAVWLALFDAQEAWLAGDVRRVAAVADAFETQTQTRAQPARIQEEAATQLFFVNLSLGRLVKADALVTNMPSWVDETVRDQQRGRVIALRGDQRALAAFLSQRFRTPERAKSVASNLIDAGLFRMARGVIAYHRQRRSAEADEWYAGQLALAEGRIDEAIRRLTAAARRFPERNNQGLKIARQLADAYHASGAPGRALELLESSTRDRSAVTDGWEWLRSRDRLAQRYREAGRVDAAVAVERELAALLAVADADHAIKRRLNP